MLLWGDDPTTARLLWASVLVLALLAAVQVLIGAAAGTSPTDAREPIGEGADTR